MPRCSDIITFHGERTLFAVASNQISLEVTKWKSHCPLHVQWWQIDIELLHRQRIHNSVPASRHLEGLFPPFWYQKKNQNLRTSQWKFLLTVDSWEWNRESENKWIYSSCEMMWWCALLQLNCRNTERYKNNKRPTITKRPNIGISILD